MSTSPGTSVASFPEITTAPAGGALAPARVIAAIRPFATSTSRAGVRTPFATSSTATSAIQTALGGGALRATRTDGTELAHAATSAAAANTANREPTRFVTAP